MGWVRKNSLQKNTNQFCYTIPSTVNVNGEYAILFLFPHENDNASQNDDENDDRYSWWLVGWSEWVKKSIKSIGIDNDITAAYIINL